MRCSNSRNLGPLLAHAHLKYSEPTWGYLMHELRKPFYSSLSWKTTISTAYSFIAFEWDSHKRTHIHPSWKEQICATLRLRWRMENHTSHQQGNKGISNFGRIWIRFTKQNENVSCKVSIVTTLHYSALGQKAVPRFGECCCCSCLLLLPGLACSTHATWGPPFSRAL